MMDNPETPLTEAVDSNSTEAAKLLIDAGANLFPEHVNINTGKYFQLLQELSTSWCAIIQYRYTGNFLRF